MVKPKKKKKILTTVTQMTTNDFWEFEDTKNDLLITMIGLTHSM